MSTVTHRPLQMPAADTVSFMAKRQPVTVADLDRIIGVGLPLADATALATTVNDLARIHTDRTALTRALLQLTTSPPAPWRDLVPAGRTEMPLLLIGTSSDRWPGNCDIPPSDATTRIDARIRVSADGSAGWIVHNGREAPIGPDGRFSVDVGAGATFSGRILRDRVELSSVMEGPVLRHGATRDAHVVNTRIVRGGPGGPGYDALGDIHREILNRVGDKRAPLGLRFGLPTDVDGGGRHVHRRGGGVLQGFVKGIVAKADGAPDAHPVTGSILTAWKAQWTPGDVGALGHPVSDVRRVNRGDVQVFENGYVFADGTVQLRANALAAFAEVFPETLTPPSVLAERAAAADESWRESQRRGVMKPFLPTLEHRVRARQGGGFHATPDRDVIQKFIDSLGPNIPFNTDVESYKREREKLLQTGLQMVKELEARFPPPPGRRR